MDEKLVKYFIEETNKKFEKLETKVDQLLEFKWQALGVLVSFNFIVIAVLQIYFK